MRNSNGKTSASLNQDEFIQPQTSDMNYTTDRDFALAADREDTLRTFRDRFHIPVIGEKESIYFCGNSLGLQPKSTGEYIRQELDEWGRLS